MKALARHGPCPEHRRSFVNVGGLREDLAREDLPGGPELGDELAGDLANLAGQGGAPDNGHNGPIVDVIEEHVLLEGGRR
jgi:hypothetical protein